MRQAGAFTAILAAVSLLQVACAPVYLAGGIAPTVGSPAGRVEPATRPTAALLLTGPAAFRETIRQVTGEAGLFRSFWIDPNPWQAAQADYTIALSFHARPDPGGLGRVLYIIFGGPACLDLVKSGEVDFGIGCLATRDREITISPLMMDPVSALFPAGHPLERRRRITLEDLLAVPLIVAFVRRGIGPWGRSAGRWCRRTKRATPPPRSASSRWDSGSPSSRSQRRAKRRSSRTFSSAASTIPHWSA